MSVSLYVNETITTSGIVKNMPGGRLANVQCSDDITIAFWNPAASAFGIAEALAAPGGQVYCPNDHARITTDTTSAITVTLTGLD